jgi:hypothetical protein
MSTPGAMVDAANVCWSPLLPPVGRHAPVLSRVLLVRDAWRARFGSDAPVELVADSSLASYLRKTPDERRLAQLESSGELRLTPYADPEILSLARDRGWYVISADQFKDHRNEHRWIAEYPERFLSWKVGEDGSLQLVPSGIREISAQVASRALEGKRLSFSRRIHLNRAEHRRVLAYHWRCVAPGCLRAQLWPDRILDWPYLRGSVPVCSCGESLVEAGPRGRARGFVVSEPGGRELMRFPVSVGSAVLLGRGTVPHGINLAAHEATPPPDVFRLSRRHLFLTVEDSPREPVVTVTDLGSRNGSELVRRWRRRLAPDRPTRLVEGDRIVLAGVAELRLSGRRYFSEEETSRSADDTSGDGTTTLLAHDEENGETR